MGALSHLLPGVPSAANLHLPPWAVAALAGFYGTLHGQLNGATPAAVGVGWARLLGIASLALLLSTPMLAPRPESARIAARVIDSWFAICGLRMLGRLRQGAS